MATLYEIDDQLKRIIDAGFMTAEGEKAYVDGATGEMFDAAALDALQVSKKEKIEAIGRFILNLESDAAAHDAEGDRQYEKADKKRKKAERLREYLALHMDAGETYHGTAFDIGWTRSQSVQIENVEAIPAEYLRTIPARKEPDKRAIMAAYRHGKEIPGASLQTRERLKVK